MSYIRYSRNRFTLLGSLAKVGMVILGVLLVVAVVVAIGGLIGQWAWRFVVPDVFAGAVGKGILPARITFIQALKLSFLCGIFIGSCRVVSSSKK